MHTNKYVDKFYIRYKTTVCLHCIGHIVCPLESESVLVHAWIQHFKQTLDFITTYNAFF